jgi:hypothetical protein
MKNSQPHLGMAACVLGTGMITRKLGVRGGAEPEETGPTEASAVPHRYAADSRVPGIFHGFMAESI